jgi:hypothetical protein
MPGDQMLVGRLKPDSCVVPSDSTPWFTVPDRHDVRLTTIAPLSTSG